MRLETRFGLVYVKPQLPGKLSKANPCRHPEKLVTCSGPFQFTTFCSSAQGLGLIPGAFSFVFASDANMGYSLGIQQEVNLAPNWHSEARKMRSEGAKLLDIGLAFGVTLERARQVCKGVECPIDHTAFFRDPEWRAAHRKKPTRRLERESFIRAHYKQDMTAAEIGKALGITRNAVISSANGLGLCTPSIPQPKQTIPHT